MPKIPHRASTLIKVSGVAGLNKKMLFELTIVNSLWSLTWKIFHILLKGVIKQTVSIFGYYSTP